MSDIEKDEQLEFEVGDRVVQLNTGEKGTIARLGSDKSAVQVKWDGGMQQMVDISTLKKE